MDLINGYLQKYEWGSLSALAELRGIEASGTPEAELWFGIHPSGPATLEREHGQVPLQQALNEIQEEMPYLVKVLAADQPLSLQAHPNVIQASSGFEDKRSKPEMICALTQFEALCGFKSVSAALEICSYLNFASDLLSVMESSGDFTEVTKSILTQDREEAVTALLQRCYEAEEEMFSSEISTIKRLAEKYPKDQALLLIPMMRKFTLEPGQALFLDPGVLHSYLGGVALEVMGSSDNVVRAGFTSKPKDPLTLLGIIDFELRPEIQIASSSHHRFKVPTSEFDVEKINASVQVKDREGTDVVVAASRETTLTSQKETLIIQQGSAAWVPLAEGSYEIQTLGTAYRVVG